MGKAVWERNGGQAGSLGGGGFGGCTQALVLSPEGYPEETTCRNRSGTHLGTGPLEQSGGLQPGDLQPGSQGQQKWEEGGKGWSRSHISFCHEA